ncbi:stage II sporulation protein P [Desulforamulus aquiferis]|uniref:stage II sporulation protein P n=1 Tax=Desulforamulus aquiferis TaxID=1397668 RepID=UPI002715361F|nr:stage II sporulation protein P [Desulforamulus aquiferis]
MLDLKLIGDSGGVVRETVGLLVKTTIQDPRVLVLTSMPALARLDTPDEMENQGHAIILWVAGLARINTSPTGMLLDQIPLLAKAVAGGAPVISETPKIIEEEPVLQPELSSDILVAIYNTHTGEAYAISEGTERVAGKGGVVAVAAEIQQVLEKKFSIRVVRSEKVHDLQYATSYIESEKTARELVAKYPKMLAMLDIHRDAGKTREQSLVEINGNKVATILMVVGSDARRPFPNWKENYNFACQLADKLDELYPGLCIGVQVKEGRYNQFLHPGAVLVEMGTVENSLEEAKASGEMFAEALGEVLKEKLKAKEVTNLEEETLNHLELDYQVEENAGEVI